jgi:hypothetical protein
MSQRVTSYYLYKHSSRPIDVSPTIEQTQFTFILVFTLVFLLFLLFIDYI